MIFDLKIYFEGALHSEGDRLMRNIVMPSSSLKKSAPVQDFYAALGVWSCAGGVFRYRHIMVWGTFYWLWC